MINSLCCFSIPDSYDNIVKIIQQIKGIIMEPISASNWLESFLNLFGGWQSWLTTTVLSVVLSPGDTVTVSEESHFQMVLRCLEAWCMTNVSRA